MTKVGLKAFKLNAEKYVEEARKEEVIVFKRSKPLFRVAPLDEEPWEEVIDFTKIIQGGVDIDDLLARL